MIRDEELDTKVKKNLLFSFDPKQNSSINEDQNDDYEQTLSFYKRSESSEFKENNIKQSDSKKSEAELNPINIEPSENIIQTQSKRSEILEFSKDSDKENSQVKQNEDDELFQMIETHKKRKKFNLKSIAIKLERSHSENVEDNTNFDEVWLKEIKLNTDKNSKKISRIHADNKYKSPKKTQNNDLKDIFANCMEFSHEKLIEEIKEDPNETFTSLNMNKNDQFDDSSLFASPQISNKHQEKLPTSECKNERVNSSKHQNQSKNTSGAPSISFRRKESSENQIKELFMTSPLISSPDFDKPLNAFNQLLEQADQENYPFNVNISLSDKQSHHSDFSSIKNESDQKQISSNSNTAEKELDISTKISSVFVKSLVNMFRNNNLKNLKLGFSKISGFANYIKISENEQRILELKSQELQIQKENK